jgi:hypothetical protein
MLWDMSATYVPIFDSAGAASTRGATAIVDFVADKAIALPRALGGALSGSTSSLPASQTFTTAGGAGATQLTITSGNASTFVTGSPVQLTNSGGSLPTGLSTGTVYYAIYVNSTTIRLTLTPDDALSASNIVTFTGGSGSGTNSVQLYSFTLGQYRGEPSHIMLPGEVAINNLTTSAGLNVAQSAGVGGVNVALSSDGATNSTSFYTVGNASPTRFNLYQPTIFMNAFIKL